MLKRLSWRLFVAASCGACAASLLALWADDAWLADLAVNFRLQYFAIAVLALPVLAWRRSLPLAAATLVTLALNGGPVLAYFQDGVSSAPLQAAIAVSPGATLPRVAATASPGATASPSITAIGGSATNRVARTDLVPLRIASANVFFLNADYADVTDWARRTRPDVLLLLEVTAAWRSGLAALEADYPHVQYVTDHDHHGLLLLSNWPLTDVVTRPAIDPGMRPVVFSTLTKDGARLRLAAMHATWPMQPANARQRQRDLGALAAEAARRGSLAFVGIGDFNISPFSPHYQHLLQQGGLRNAAAGRGWQPTWPAVLWPLGIQIDHALVSPEVQVQDFQRGPRNGSDHVPIIVDVLIPRFPALMVHK